MIYFSIAFDESVSISNITENERMDFHEIFRTGQIWDKDQSWSIVIFSVSIITNNITEKMW